jgi:drug/metabolite transporter (DMT)-like permease
VIATVADAHGSHGFAFYALLAAVPFASASAIVSFGEFLDGDEDAVTGLQSLLWGCVVVLLVLSCAARSPATQTHTLPPLGASALLACLGVFALKACVFAAPLLRRLALVRPAKP